SKRCTALPCTTPRWTSTGCALRVRPGLHDLVEEARTRTGVTRRPRRPHPQQHGVGVAVEAGLDHGHDVAAGLALLPEALPRAAVEGGPATAPRRLPRLAVHVGHHQHLTGLRVLHHRGDQSRRIEGGLDLGSHRRTSTPWSCRYGFTAGAGKAS